MAYGMQPMAGLLNGRRLARRGLLGPGLPAPTPDQIAQHQGVQPVAMAQQPAPVASSGLLSGGKSGGGLLSGGRVGDALTALGYGLLGGSTGDWAPGFQSGLQAAQQRSMQRSQAERQQQEDARANQEWQWKVDERARADQQAATAAEQRAQIRAGLTPDQQKLFDLDPDGFAKRFIENQMPDAPEFKGYETKVVRVGNEDVTYLFNPITGEQKEIGRGRAFAPQQGPQAPETIRLLQAAGIDPGSPEGQAIIKQKLSGGNGITVYDPATGQPITTIGGSGGVGKLTEAQGQAASRAALIGEGLNTLNKLLLSPDVNPWRMEAANLVGGISEAAGNKIRSEDEQRWNAAKSAALEGLASAVTGAGVTKDQFDRYSAMLPTPSDAPAVAQEKMAAANRFLQTQLLLAGPAGQAVAAQLWPEKQGGAASAVPPASASAPDNGQVVTTLPPGFQ